MYFVALQSLRTGVLAHASMGEHLTDMCCTPLSFSLLAADRCAGGTVFSHAPRWYSLAHACGPAQWSVHEWCGRGKDAQVHIVR